MKEFIQYVIRLFHAPNSATASILIFFIILTVLYYSKRIILEVLRNKHTWGIVAMLFCFAMVSGYTWNKMAKPAFYVNNNDGAVLINRNPKRQFVAESYIVAALNASVVVGMILSIEGAGGVRGIETYRTQREGKRRLQIMAGLALMFASFALLLSVFKVKRPWYPYRYMGQSGWINSMRTAQCSPVERFDTLDALSKTLISVSISLWISLVTITPNIITMKVSSKVE